MYVNAPSSKTMRPPSVSMPYVGPLKAMTAELPWMVIAAARRSAAVG